MSTPNPFILFMIGFTIMFLLVGKPVMEQINVERMVSKIAFDTIGGALDVR